MPTRVTLKTLQKWSRLWQERLNLKEWTIDTHFFDKTSLADASICDDSCYGATYWDKDHQEAVIVIHRKFDDMPIEKTVIHELVHLVLDGHKDPKKNELHNERSVIRLTEALWNAHKRTHKPKTVKLFVDADEKYQSNRAKKAP